MLCVSPSDETLVSLTSIFGTAIGGTLKEEGRHLGVLFFTPVVEPEVPRCLVATAVLDSLHLVVIEG